MEHNRKNKLLMIIALIAGIASLSIGFAAFSVSLNISSSASVTPSSDTFSVKFSSSSSSLSTDSVVAFNMSSLTSASHGVIDNSAQPKITNFKASFIRPGQFVEYYFYARNEGEYTAYLNNINFLGNKTCIGEAETTDSLVQSACESINILVTIADTTYTETSAITSRPLAQGKSETIKVRLEYASNGSYVDGPFSVNFPDIALVYSSIDDPSMKPVVSAKPTLVSGNLNNPGSIVSIGDEQFYVIGQENGNVKLLSMYNLHVGSMVVDFYTATPLENPTGIQDKDAKAFNWDSVNQVRISPYIGSTAFSNISSSYEGSIVEGYVNDYAAYLEGLGANIEEARLITKSEIESLECKEVYVICDEAPKWLFSTSYWSGSNYDNGNVYGVDIRGQVIPQPYSYPYDLGVRPVIEIALSEF